ncbi:MAG: protoheme IX farnesyltransferase [Gammaproteobacteria bacterium RIFCSPLOWO2_02_FULL_61_13]|nr:MAG: protoheme IX farnesyltransferase [Gammaproteobacteria bacterium RIFCSPLOWO2_02_FULL_61_13]
MENAVPDSVLSVNPLARWRDYLALCKPTIVALIVFTAVVGMFLSTPGMVPWDALLFGTLGIGLAAASAAAVNHIVDQHIDSIMSRTRSRPLPRGNLSPAAATRFAFTLGLLSMLILVFFVNVLTAVLTLVSLIGYGFIYSMYLKRATPQNIVIGGAAGAAPPVLGWVAVTNQLDPVALLLFLIIFAWTPPHFWALAIYRRKDYANAEIPMLPVTHGVEFTRLHILLYTVVLFIVTMLPYVMYMSGPMYLCGAVALGGGFLYYAIRMQRDHSDRLALAAFNYSIIYLMALFAFLLVDHYMPALLPLLD